MMQKHFVLALMVGLLSLPVAVAAVEADDGFDTLMGMAEAPSAATPRCKAGPLAEELALYEADLEKQASLGCKVLAARAGAAQKLAEKVQACGATALQGRATKVGSELGRLEDERCAVARAGGLKAVTAIVNTGLEVADHHKGAGKGADNGGGAGSAGAGTFGASGIRYDIDEAKSQGGATVYRFYDLGCVTVAATGKIFMGDLEKVATMQCPLEAQFLYKERYADQMTSDFVLISRTGNPKDSRMSGFAKRLPITKTTLVSCPSQRLMEATIKGHCSEDPLFKTEPFNYCECNVWKPVGTAN